MGNSSSETKAYSLPPAENDALTRLYQGMAGHGKVATKADLRRVLVEERRWDVPPGALGNLHSALCSGDRRDSQWLTLQTFLTNCASLFGQGPPFSRDTLWYPLHLERVEVPEGEPLPGNLPEPTVKKVTVQSAMLTVDTFMNLVCSSPVLEEVFPHWLDWTADNGKCRNVASFIIKGLSDQSDPAVAVVESKLKSWVSSAPLVESIYTTAFVLMFLHGALPLVELRQKLGYSVEEETKIKTFHSLLVPEVLRVPFHPTGHMFTSTLLDMSAMMLLNSSFPGDVKGRVFPLFSSRIHGESFSTLVGRIVKQGPVLLVIRDTEGNIFGGFAAESWTIGPEFKGNASCFLFTLHPHVGVYSSTGYNSNFMYLEQNAQTLPNGLGMGGQLDYFGLWLSADFGHGHSMARPSCTTYGSPALSASDQFSVESLEAWGVGDPPEPEVKEKSILDKDKTAQTVLELAGKTRHSEGLRTPVESDEENS